MSLYFRNQKEYHLNDAIDEFLSKYRLKEGYVRIQIATIWNNTVGKVIALHTKKVELNNTTLIVYIASPIVKNELVMLKSEIIAKLNEDIGKELIKELIIK
jgi:predicted nucleic acid-binding Zn ribbon protein